MTATATAAGTAGNAIAATNTTGRVIDLSDDDDDEKDAHAGTKRKTSQATKYGNSRSLASNERYLRNLCMFTVNRPHLFEMYTSSLPMRELYLKLGF